MQDVQRIALTIYLVVLAFLLLFGWWVLAPFLGQILGWRGQTTRWAIVAVTAVAGGLTARSIVLDKDPLGRLAKVLSSRPNRGRSAFPTEATLEAQGDHPTPEEALVEKGRHEAIVPK